MSNCYNKGRVSGEEQIVGGICGRHSENASITNCYNTGEVSCNGNLVGGVCGESSGRYGAVAVTNCYNTGKVSGTGTSIGGIYGFSEYGTITHCYYLAEEEDNTGGKTEEQFHSGEVTYLLARGSTVDGTFYDGSIWGQNLSKDSFPVFHGAKVFCTTPCPSYSNSSSGTKAHTIGGDGICTVCGGYDPPKFDEELNRYEISNVRHLYWFAQQVNGGNTDINAVLTKDIVINPNVLNEDGTLNSGDLKDWIPIGNENNKYSGTFEGNDHTVRGLYFDSEDEKYVGLFGYVGSSGKISKVSVADSYLKGSNDVGGYV